MELYQLNVSAQYQHFKETYNEKCALAFDTEEFKYTGPDRYYQYTLFYYDQGGNLVRTIAPQGVNVLPNSNNGQINVTVDNVGLPVNGVTKPVHEYQAKYLYNSYDQLISTTNPDQEGDTKF